MADDRISEEEISLRRYEARMGVWKVILGTMIVGLAGVLIPSAVNLTTLVLENSRSKAELKLAQQTAHRQYIKDFFDTAVNEDIELRIRFANYFQHLSGEEQKALWASYLNDLQSQRNRVRDEIDAFEARLVDLKKVPEAEVDISELDRTNRRLYWAYAEIGYVQPGRSAVPVISGKKERLYRETAALVSRLAEFDGVIDAGSVDYVRFWELYKVDLIGVESREVARRMVALGNHLKSLVANNAPPNDETKLLSEDVRQRIFEELAVEELTIGTGWNNLEQWIPVGRATTLPELVDPPSEN